MTEPTREREKLMTDWERLAIEAYHGWRHGEDVAGPMMAIWQRISERDTTCWYCEPRPPNDRFTPGFPTGTRHA